MMPFPAGLPTGVLLPESIVHSDSFQILATFVAINSLIYATLAVLKVLPKGYALARYNKRRSRTQNRSIHPEPPAPDQFESLELVHGPADNLQVLISDATSESASPRLGTYAAHRGSAQLSL